MYWNTVTPTITSPLLFDIMSGIPPLSGHQACHNAYKFIWECIYLWNTMKVEAHITRLKWICEEWGLYYAIKRSVIFIASGYILQGIFKMTKSSALPPQTKHTGIYSIHGINGPQLPAALPQ